MKINIKEIENKYRSLETEELIRIVSTNVSDYLPDAVAVAKEELKKRNIAKDKISEVSKTQEKEEKIEREGIEKAPLSKRIRFFLTIFPGMAYWHHLFRIFAPESKYKYIQKQRDALFCLLKSLVFYLVLAGIIWLLESMGIGNMITYVGTIIGLLIILYRFS